METLRIDNLEQYLLLKNGNYLYKVPFRGGFAVLKVYFGSRTPLQYLTKSLGNVLLANQTSFMPRARRRTEYQVSRLWEAAGFRVFRTYDDVAVEDLPEGGWTLFEYAPGKRFVDYFADPQVPWEEKLRWWRRFVPEWHRRHRLAVQRREPRLVHENGDLKHVMIWQDELLYFDFEMVFRSRRRVREFVAREILSYLKSLGKTVGPHHWECLLAETVRLYEGRDLLEYTHRFAFANPNPFLRLARRLDRMLKPRSRKPFSKYSVARRLKHYLESGPGAPGANNVGDPRESRSGVDQDAHRVAGEIDGVEGEVGKGQSPAHQG